MKLRLHGSRSTALDASLNTDDDTDDDTEWPAVVRRLAAKVQHGRDHEPRKAKAPRRNDDPEQLKRIARVKTGGIPH
jgi:hypothetical protein